jgi:spore maturation protein CgeB
MKDFLAFHGYSKNFNFKILCDTLISFGYIVDRVDETRVLNFPYGDQYRYIIMCWHSENIYYEFIKDLVKSKYTDVPMILFDDTDWNHKTMKFAKEPFVVFKRELTAKTKKIRGIPYYQMAKIVQDNYHPEIEKIYDISFVGSVTSKSRGAFVEKIRQIKKEKWFIHETKHSEDMPYDEYIKIINQSKIGLSYFGNGYDTVRYWEIISCKTALLSQMVPLPIENNLSKEEAVFFREDMSDLEEKIDYLLEGDRWKNYGEKGYRAFIARHSNIVRTKEFLAKMEAAFEIFEQKQKREKGLIHTMRKWV